MVLNISKQTCGSSGNLIHFRVIVVMDNLTGMYLNYQDRQKQ